MTRWNRRLLLGAIAVLVPALAGCEAGFNAPTLEFHPASSGVSTTVNGITLNNLFVLGAPVGSAIPAGGRAGVFLTLKSQNGDRLVAVSAPGAASSVKLTGGPVNLPAQTPVYLGGPVPQMVLTGLASPLGGGETVQLTLVFAWRGWSRSACRSSRTPTTRDLLPARHPQAHAVGQAQGRVSGSASAAVRRLGVGPRIRQPIGHAVAGGSARSHPFGLKIFLSRTSGVRALQAADSNL